MLNVLCFHLGYDRKLPNNTCVYGKYVLYLWYTVEPVIKTTCVLWPYVIRGWPFQTPKRAFFFQRNSPVLRPKRPQCLKRQSFWSIEQSPLSTLPRVITEYSWIIWLASSLSTLKVKTMEKVNVGYSTKNIPISSNKEHQRNFIGSACKHITAIRMEDYLFPKLRCPGANLSPQTARKHGFSSTPFVNKFKAWSPSVNKTKLKIVHKL